MKLFITITLLLFVFTIITSSSIVVVASSTQHIPINNYDSSNNSNNDTINVFIIPHSHCDVGWIETYESYYTGIVHNILTNVVKELVANPTRRFNWAEIVYFERWWSEQTSLVQAQVRQLVLSGQLEFVGGGWAQNDEAVTHHEAIINQMTIGHQFLLSTFGITPVVGWQIDPFGASTMTAQLFKLMGFKYHVIDRVDDRLKYVFNVTPDVIPGSGILTTNRSFEFNWYPSPSYDAYNEDFSIFTHILDNHYESPNLCWPSPSNPNTSICVGFDFEGSPNNNPQISDENIAQQSLVLVEIIRQRAALYRHSNLLIPFGGDFRFQRAYLEFSNMDKLIAYINENPDQYNVNIQYATVSEYFEAVQKDTLPTDFPTQSGGKDYFTYTQCSSVNYANYGTCVEYWSGYFTSYPTLKQLVRKTDRILRAGEVLYSWATSTFKYSQAPFLEQPAFDALAFHRNVSGILTHHDAVTGTATINVREDYTSMLEAAGQQTMEIVFPSAVGFLLSNISTELGYNVSIDQLESMKPGQALVIAFTNSLGWNRVEYVGLPALNQSYAVYDYNLNPVVSQLNVGPPSRQEFADNKKKREAVQRIDLMFQVFVPAIGVSSYFIVCLDEQNNTNTDYQSHFGLSTPIPSFRSVATQVTDSSTEIGNNLYSLKFTMDSDNDGLLQLVGYNDLVNGESYQLGQSLLEYHSYQDDCYKFRPTGSAYPMVTKSPASYLNMGPLAQIVTIIYSNNVSQIFTVLNETTEESGSIAQENQYILVENIVAAAFNREIIMRFTTDIDNNQTFYSSNGLESIQREYQEKYDDDNVSNMVAGNYFPSINMAKIQDGSVELAILNDQSMGVSSQYPGTLECMLLRRSNYTQTSIHQDLDDISLIHLSHRILFGKVGTVEIQRPSHSIIHENPYIPLMAPIKSGVDGLANYADLHNTLFSPFPTANNENQLPTDLHLMTLSKQWNDNNACLMRIANIYEADASQIYGQPSTVSFTNLFSLFNTTNVQETTLTANSLIQGGEEMGSEPISITLNPIEIRTFVFNLNEGK